MDDREWSETNARFDREEAVLRIPMKPPGYTDLKPLVVPISKRPPFQSQTARDGVVS